MGALAVLAVALGGALGALGRWGITLLAERYRRDREQLGVPWPTFAANMLACALVGVIAAAFGGPGPGPGHVLYLLLATGMGGALSTLSTLALEVVDLVRRGSTVVALGYALLSAGAGLVLFWLGLVLGS